MPWQADLLAALDDPTYSRLAFSIARANGKTTCMSAVAFLRFLQAGPNADVLLVASSFEQGRNTLARPLPAWAAEFAPGVAIRDSPQRFDMRRDNGARLAVLGCDPRRMHGRMPALILADEPAQWPRAGAARMFEAINSSLGKSPDAKLAAFSTRPASYGHWFNRLLRSVEPHVWTRTYTADADADPHSPEAWLAANPSLPYFPDLRRAIEQESRDAIADPELLGQFRAYRLNQPVDSEDRTIVSVEEWARLEHDAERGGPCYVGVDLGAADSLTAAAAFWPVSGRLEVYAGCGSYPSIEARGARDGLPYEYWKQAGLLWLWPSRVTPVREFLEAVGTELAGVEVAGVEADSYRAKELEDALDELRLPWPALEVIRPHKSKPGGAFDCREFRKVVLTGELAAMRGRPMLEAAIADSRITLDRAATMRWTSPTRTAGLTRYRPASSR